MAPYGPTRTSVRSGPQFDDVAPEGHGWGAAAVNRFVVHHNDTPGSYPPRFLHAHRRVSEGNYAMLAMVEHGDGARYVKMTDTDWWRLRWLPRDDWVSRASDVSVIDTIHMRLQETTNGDSRLRHPDLLRSCGPHVRSLFLHSDGKTCTGAQVLELVDSCPNLTTLSLTECHVDDALLRGIAASPCASRLAGLRLMNTGGVMSPTALGVLVEAASPTLVWLDVQLAFHPIDNRSRGTLDVDHTPWLAPLGRCGLLRVALLPHLTATALGLLATPASKLELLSLDDCPPMPLSALEPFVHAGFGELDLHGFFLDANASDDACACANRLIVGDARGLKSASEVLPRARLLKCTRLVDLELRCDLSEEDVNTCLVSLHHLRSLHMQGGELEPAVIGAFGKLRGLRSLNLSGCLRNYYDYGEEIATKNVTALLRMAGGLKSLVQLDLSHHFDSFYATVEDKDENCPYDLLYEMARKMPKLRLLNLAENGHKFGWCRLRREMRGLNEWGKTETPCVGALVKIHSLVASPEHNGVTGTVERYDANKVRWGVKIASGRLLSLKSQNLSLHRDVGTTIHYGDGVTVFAAGTPEAGEGVGGSYDGPHDDDDYNDEYYEEEYDNDELDEDDE